MSNSKSAFIDTNALIRLTLTNVPLHTEALTIVQNFWNDGYELWISRQVLREYLSVLTRPQTFSNPLPIEVLREDIRNFQAQFRVAEDSAKVTDQLLDLMRTIPMGGRQVHDANIVATMLVYGVSELLTHNIEDFKRFSTHITLMPLEAT